MYDSSLETISSQIKGRNDCTLLLLTAGTFSSNGINDMVIQKQLSSQDSFFSFKPSLSDIYEHSKDGDQGRKFGLLTSATRSQSVTTSSCSRSSPTSKQGTSASQTGDENSSETLGSPYAKDIPLKESSEHRPTKSCEVGSFIEIDSFLWHFATDNFVIKWTLFLLC